MSVAMPLLKVLVVGVALLTIISISVITWLYFYQEKLIFPAKQLPDSFQFQFDQPFKEVNIPIKGGQLNALIFPQPEPRGLVFFLKGNGGNLVDWTTQLEFYQEANYDLFIFDYRSYGKSRGKITSEAQMHADVRAAWDWIIDEYRGKKTVIYGRSIGTAFATKLAVEVEPDLLILVSPFTSMVAMAKQVYPWAPTSLLRYRFNTDELIGNIKTPVAYAHGSDDIFIKPNHMQSLYDLTLSKKDKRIIEGAGHNDIHLFPEYWQFFMERMP